MDVIFTNHLVGIRLETVVIDCITCLHCVTEANLGPAHIFTNVVREPKSLRPLVQMNCACKQQVFSHMFQTLLGTI